MTMSTDRTAWQRLGNLLIQRRTALDPRFRSRQAFATATGLKYRLIYDVEEAKRTNFGSPTLAAIEVAYHLNPGAILRYLDGGELIQIAGGNRMPPQASAPAPQPDPDELGAWERAVWSEVSDALARHGPGATGAQVFPGSAVEASVWDTRKLPDREAKVRLIAKLRAISDESSAESRAG